MLWLGVDGATHSLIFCCWTFLWSFNEQINWSSEVLRARWRSSIPAAVWSNVTKRRFLWSTIWVCRLFRWPPANFWALMIKRWSQFYIQIQSSTFALSQVRQYYDCFSYLKNRSSHIAFDDWSALSYYTHLKGFRFLFNTSFPYFCFTLRGLILMQTTNIAYLLA